MDCTNYVTNFIIPLPFFEADFSLFPLKESTPVLNKQTKKKKKKNSRLFLNFRPWTLGNVKYIRLITVVFPHPCLWETAMAIQYFSRKIAE